MAGEALLAFAVGVEDRGVDFGRFGFEPGEQSGAEVEADAGVVVDQLDDAVVAVDDPRYRVGRVALGGDALVPVVIGIGRVLQLDGFEPGVFPGRLVEVAVDADLAFHENLISPRRHEGHEGFG